MWKKNHESCILEVKLNFLTKNSKNNKKSCESSTQKFCSFQWIVSQLGRLEKRHCSLFKEKPQLSNDPLLLQVRQLNRNGFPIDKWRFDGWISKCWNVSEDKLDFFLSWSLNEFVFSCWVANRQHSLAFGQKRTIQSKWRKARSKKFIRTKGMVRCCLSVWLPIE